MASAKLILLVFALVFEVLAAFGVNPPRFQFGWGGVALLIIAFMFA